MTVKRLSIPGRLEEIERVSRVVGDCATGVGFDELTSYACELAVGEACENIIKHGYGHEIAGLIRVKIEANPGEIVVELSDDAPPFDAAKAPEPESWAPDDPPVGGLGLRIIHTVMDEIQYCRLDQGNRLRLRKCIPRHQDPT
jgi:anti-sigma regulatory factor (Ser/Thr protein kinase)